MELQKREIIEASKKLTEGMSKANQLVTKFTHEIAVMDLVGVPL